jgi:hypothetical protein
MQRLERSARSSSKINIVQDFHGGEKTLYANKRHSDAMHAPRACEQIPQPIIPERLLVRLNWLIEVSNFGGPDLVLKGNNRCH